MSNEPSSDPINEEPKVHHRLLKERISSNNFTRLFDYPPPNFEKATSQGWTMIARAIICPEDRLGKYIAYVKRWKDKESELGKPRYIPEYKPKKKPKRNKAENAPKKMVTIISPEDELDSAKSESQQNLEPIEEIENESSTKKVDKTPLRKKSRRFTK